MDKVAIYTQAYNAEKTLSHTIDSVLSQTHTDFIYYLCDHGSTDKTREIIEEYAAGDSRIVPIYLNENHAQTFNNQIESIRGTEYDFFCGLDADDEYLPDFMEKMLAFSKDNDLDVVCCGSDFVNGATGAIMGTRTLPENMILDNVRAFEQNFPTYYQFARTVWAKLYRASVINAFDIDALRTAEISNGLDTFFVFSIFSIANHIGIVRQLLHRYYVHPTSTYNTFNPQRMRSNYVLYDKAKEFLMEKCGTVSIQNERFLLLVYIAGVHDALTVIMNAQIPFIERAQHIEDGFTHIITQALLQQGGLIFDRLDALLRAPVLKYLLAQRECRQREGARAATRIILAMYPDLPYKAELWELLLLDMPEMIEILLAKEYKQVLGRLKSRFKQHEQDDPLLTELEILCYRNLKIKEDSLFVLLTSIKKDRPTSARELNINEQIEELISTSPFLESVSAELAFAFSRSVEYILKEEFDKGLNEFIVSSQNVEIPNEDAAAYFLLGQNLSAAADDSQAYIYFKKIWISYLIDTARNDEAQQELDEFRALLPEDEDFAALQERLKASE